MYYAMGATTSHSSLNGCNGIFTLSESYVYFFTPFSRQRPGRLILIKVNIFLHPYTYMHKHMCAHRFHCNDTKTMLITVDNLLILQFNPRPKTPVIPSVIYHHQNPLHPKFFLYFTNISEFYSVEKEQILAMDPGQIDSEITFSGSSFLMIFSH
jgi:hypothetical protein